MRLAGKVALISGGARGMGAVEARLFAQEGARIVIGDILEAEGAAVAAGLVAKGGEAEFVRLDVTSESDWERAVATAERRFGKLDVLVNNAGIGGAGRLEDTTEADWDRVMDVNAKGVFLGTKAAIPALRRAGGGSIVNISSSPARATGSVPSRRPSVASESWTCSSTTRASAGPAGSRTQRRRTGIAWWT